MPLDPAFTSIAPYYDILMEAVDYAQWARYVAELFTQARREVREVMDLACGTGNLTGELASLGYDVSGLDTSTQMLAVAKEKLPGLRLYQGDFVEWGIDREFDAVVCVYDSLNNLLSDGDMARAFAEVRDHLRHGGVFVFDLNTIHGLEHYWDNNTKVTESDGLVAVWRTTFLEPDLSRLHISVFARQGQAWKRVDEVHTERGYTRAQTLRLLKRSGFRSARAYQHMSTISPDRKTGRITYLGVK